MKLTADALNHLLRQNSWALGKLLPFAGKTIRITIPPLQSTLTIDASGMCAAAVKESIVDASIQMGAGAALRMLMQPEAAMGLATLEGDMAFASTFGKVLQNLQWDAEEDLSRIIGDIPAHQLSQAGTHIRRELGRQAASVAGMFAEYWLEEDPLIAKKTHLAQFSRDVDLLREDAERLEKRLEQLEQRRT